MSFKTELWDKQPDNQVTSGVKTQNTWLPASPSARSPQCGIMVSATANPQTRHIHAQKTNAKKPSKHRHQRPPKGAGTLGGGPGLCVTCGGRSAKTQGPLSQEKEGESDSRTGRPVDCEILCDSMTCPSVIYTSVHTLPSSPCNCWNTVSPPCWPVLYPPTQPTMDVNTWKKYYVVADVSILSM